MVQAVTGASGRILIAGIGFRRGAGADAIAGLIHRALAEAHARPDDLRILATADDRAGDGAIREAGAAFGLVPVGIPAEALAACDGRVATRSPRIQALRGVGSLCEASALAAAGPEGELVLPRIAEGGVTCALAARHERSGTSRR